MEKELVIDVSSSEITVALLEDKVLVELNTDYSTSHYSVGDIFLGKVTRLMPALNSAFVDIGDDKDAFVHYLDLGINFKKQNQLTQQLIIGKANKEDFAAMPKVGGLGKEGQISDVLHPGQEILVQVVKEPISTKGARVTGEISIAGRNMVLIPFASKVHISQKISSREERGRLERLMISILPPNYGVVVRTVAEGKKTATLVPELEALVKRWNICCDKMYKSNAPQLLLRELNRTSTILRDVLSESFNSVYVNDETVFREMQEYVAGIAPEHEKIVKLYNGNTPIFDYFNVSKQIRSSFGRLVPLKQGAYLIVEHTEALHVIDVNSGVRLKNAKDQEQHALNVNLTAAEMIARQLRLRDMGGILVVDFIDMDKSEHRQQLFEKMQELMENDRAKHNILPLSRFGLMQITRQRVRPVTVINTAETCPSCRGTGKISASFVRFDKTIITQLIYFVQQRKLSTVVLKAHPYVAAYFTKGLISLRRRLMWRYRCRFIIKPDSSMPYLDLQWSDKAGNNLTVV
ncbi:MAG: Rne/Rng family ribonuclease [Bacteroidales bacterium]|nr:Rne/Rng family ribonuclease [Bacteroidales bacterium]MCL2132845.1 Rne/Rng family ribonuclease [Bacteroidales bacterium]